MIERLIVVGLINSTEYLQQVQPIWDSKLMASRSAALIASWCIEYFKEYQECPARHIEDIYFDKKDSGDILVDMVEEIEEDLEDLSGEYDEDYNLRYALKQSNKYFKKRHLELHQAAVKELFDNGDVEAAQALAENYTGTTFELSDDLDLSGEEATQHIEMAFMTAADALITYAGALGRFINEYLVRGGFVALLAPEKRGKSFWLLDMAIRATRNRHKVAFFQAGDMTEGQQIKRIASYQNKLPINEKYAGEGFVPVADCILNQLDLCDKEERRCDYGVFLGGEFEESNLRREITKEALEEAFEDFGDDYTPCTNCPEFEEHRLGTPWLKPFYTSHAVTVEEAKRKVKEYFQVKKRPFRISTHPNNTLTVSMIWNKLNQWKQLHGFIPDVIIIDYADLMVAEHTADFRHQQNEIWKNLRAMSQGLDCLVLTATQADSKSYDQDLLSMNNFSEDKRKFAHVTAMFGLNQDRHFREKKIGVMRINKLVVREGEFDATSAVTVLQNLNISMPFIDSYI